MGGQRATTADADEPTRAESRASMTWSQRLKRVFDIETLDEPITRGTVLADEETVSDSCGVPVHGEFVTIAGKR